MKNDYIVRAQKFIQEIYPYLTDRSVFNCLGIAYRRLLENAVDEFSKERRRVVKVNYGSTRAVMITSDYAVKMDIIEDSQWGTSKDELWNWINRFHNCEYADRFAPITEYVYDGISFYIMPRVNGVGEHDLCEDEDEDFEEWICDELKDIHEEQYGYKNGKIIFVDYAC